MRLSGLTISAALAFVFLVGLGTWQLQRRAEKLDLMSRHEAALQKPATPFPSPANWSPALFQTMEFEKVALEGQFLSQPEIHLYALLPKIKNKLGGVGWWIIMPFELRGGGIVFVNRGFVPQEQTYPAQRPQSLAKPGNQTIVGVVRLAEKAGHFTPANDLKQNEWYLRDPDAYAHFENIDTKNVAPVVVDQISANDANLPQASDGKVQIPNNHLQYALTWYALAGVLVVMTYLLKRSRKRQL